MKKYLALFSVIIMIGSVFSACGGNTDASTPPPTQESTPVVSTEPTPATQPDTTPDPVEIRATWWGDTNRHDLYNSIIKTFTDANPHVTVVSEPVSWADYWEKLAVLTAGGNAPDFMGMHFSYQSDYINRGTLLSLDGFIADGVIDTEGWSTAALNNGMVDGVTYMMTMGTSCESTVINKGLFDSLDIEVPSFEWTWDDVKTIGLKAREALDAAGKKDAYLMNDFMLNFNGAMHYFRMKGKAFYDENGDFGFDVGELEDYWSMYKEFADLGITPDTATTVEFADATMEDSLFAKDRMLCNVFLPANQYRLYSNTFQDKDLEIIRVPAIAGGPKGENLGGASFAVSASSSPDKQLASAQLINHWLNTKEGLALFGLDQGVPGNLALKDAYMPNLDKYQQETVEFYDRIIPTLPTKSLMFPSPPGASEIDSLFRLYGEKVGYDLMDAATAAQAFYDEGNEALKKNK